jgi:hypothetical protein
MAIVRDPVSPSVTRVRSNASWPQLSVAAILLGAPLLVVVALRLPLINQLNYADAWFYSGYAWTPKHHFALFGWTYFSVRFPAILSIRLFSQAFGPGDGYVLLRYLLAVACVGALYGCTRRFASQTTALATALLVLLNPFFSRMLLWDYSAFVEVPGMLVGIALWYRGTGRDLAWTIAAAFAFSCAVFANALAGTVLVVLALVELAFALRRGRAELLALATRIALVALITVGVFALGYLAYILILGSLNPYDLLRPTISFFKENNQLSAPYVQPVSSWLFHEPRIWAPVLTCIALIATLRGRLLGGEIPMRIAQLAIGYCAFLWIFRFVVTSSVIETWWAYSLTVVTTAPAFGVLLAQGGSAATSGRRALAGVGGFALGALFVRDVPRPTQDLYRALERHEALLLGVLIVGVLAALMLRQGGARRQSVAVAVFFMATAILVWAPSILDGRGTTGVFVTSGTQEWRGYNAGYTFLHLLRNYDVPGRRVFLWYEDLLGYDDIAWGDLPQTGDTLQEVGTTAPFGKLSPLGVARLADRTVKYVMVLSPRAQDLPVARAALARAGFPNSIVLGSKLADGGLRFVLVRLAGR